MFGNKEENEIKKKFISTGTHNHFAEGTIINGEISSEGDIRIEGKIIGIVKSKAKIAVGVSGSIEGDVQCKNADIDGKITGTLVVKGLLHLKKTAEVEGEISYGTLAVEEGAVLRGTCKLTNSTESKQVSNSSGAKEKGQQQGQQAFNKEAV